MCLLAGEIATIRCKEGLARQSPPLRGLVLFLLHTQISLSPVYCASAERKNVSMRYPAMWLNGGSSSE